MTQQGTYIEKGIKFSVVIPAYNAEKTICRAIDSVLAQAYRAHEIIVINDASTDCTEQLIQTNYNGKITYISQSENSGSSATRNLGMNAATGDYITFLDADDTWHVQKLLFVNNILVGRPDIHLIFHPYTQADINVKMPEKNILVKKLPFIKMLPANPIATSCAIVKNQADFRFDESMRYTEDYDLWLQIGYRYGIYYIDFPFTQIFRPFLSEGGISANRWKMRKGEMKAYKGLLRLNMLFLFLLPFLLLFSLAKHLYKIVVLHK